MRLPPFRLPPPTMRLRLTLLYGGLFLASGAVLIVITYVLLAHGLARPMHVGGGPLPSSAGPPTIREQPLHLQQVSDLHQFLIQSAIALAIMAGVAVALGWVMAGGVLRPLRKITVTARDISSHNLSARLAIDGPPDEVTELADTIDGLLGRLQAAFEAQRRFVAHASHELRTPLTFNRALVQVALDDPDVTFDALRATCAEVLRTEAQQERLIDALLTLARGQRGLERREAVDLALVVGDVLQAHEAEAASAGVTLSADLKPAPVWGDARLLERLVANLVQNALRHNVSQGHVKVFTGSRAGQTQLRVFNTGLLVPADQLERLLEPFARMDGDRSAGRGGFGLGLSIVAAIAQAHGASLRLHSRAGGGLDVEVRFPPAVAS